MATIKEYIYTTENNTLVNVLQCKLSQNSKIGLGIIIQTYHFSIDQVNTIDLKQDKNNCLDCPLSYSNNEAKQSKCYTHKGFQLMGLKSMLKRLNKLNISGLILPFNNDTFNANFVDKLKNVDISLTRFGSYGEPIFLGPNVAKVLKSLSKNSTGYSHQYKQDKYNWSNEFFMASTHNDKDNAIAKNRNFRSFFVLDKKVGFQNKDIINCPASKESNKKTTCVSCSLCSGNKGKSKKEVKNSHF